MTWLFDLVSMLLMKASVIFPAPHIVLRYSILGTFTEIMGVGVELPFCSRFVIWYCPPVFGTAHATITHLQTVMYANKTVGSVIRMCFVN